MIAVDHLGDAEYRPPSAPINVKRRKPAPFIPESNQMNNVLGEEEIEKVSRKRAMPPRLSGARRNQQEAKLRQIASLEPVTNETDQLSRFLLPPPTYQKRRRPPIVTPQPPPSSLLLDSDVSETNPTVYRKYNSDQIRPQSTAEQNRVMAQRKQQNLVHLSEQQQREFMQNQYMADPLAAAMPATEE